MIAHILASARYARVLRLLDLERKLILNGPLAGLKALVERREAALAEILETETELPEAFIVALKARAERNGRLLLASLAGVKRRRRPGRANPRRPRPAPHLLAPPGPRSRSVPAASPATSAPDDARGARLRRPRRRACLESSARAELRPPGGRIPGPSWRLGAGEGIRTLDPNLGKVMLYP